MYLSWCVQGSYFQLLISDCLYCARFCCSANFTRSGWQWCCKCCCSVLNPFLPICLFRLVLLFWTYILDRELWYSSCDCGLICGVGRRGRFWITCTFTSLLDHFKLYFKSRPVQKVLSAISFQSFETVKFACFLHGCYSSCYSNFIFWYGMFNVACIFHSVDAHTMLQCFAPLYKLLKILLAIMIMVWILQLLQYLPLQFNRLIVQWLYVDAFLRVGMSFRVIGSIAWGIAPSLNFFRFSSAWIKNRNQKIFFLTAKVLGFKTDVVIRYLALKFVIGFLIS